MPNSFLITNQREAGTDTNQFLIVSEITNTTTVTISRKANAGTDIPLTVCWYVIDYPEAVSVERGTNPMATTTVKPAVDGVEVPD